MCVASLLLWYFNLFSTHGCEPLSQHKAANNWTGMSFLTIPATLPPLTLLSVWLCLTFMCVLSLLAWQLCLLQPLAFSQRAGLTHYVKSFCPWGSQRWAMERWLSPVSTLALMDGYLSLRRLWEPKAPVHWCWVRCAAAQTNSNVTFSYLFLPKYNVLMSPTKRHKYQQQTS